LGLAAARGGGRWGGMAWLGGASSLLL
jgi:hypothetical protein